MPSEKQHRIGRACENCNKRKIRCKPQSGNGCEACVEHNLECISRTRKKRCSSSHFLNSQPPETAQPTRGSFTGSNAAVSQSPDIRRHDSSSNTYLLDLVQAQSEDQTSRLDPTIRCGSISRPYGWYENTIARLASDVHDAKLQSSSGHESEESVEIPELITHDNGIDVDVKSGPSGAGGLSDVDFQILQLRGAFSVPPRPIRDSLNDAFMERCYPWTPIIERTWLEDDDCNRVSMLLVQAVFLAASRVSSSASVVAYASPREFYQRAKTLFWTGHEQDALMTIRAACILNWYLPHGPEQISFDTSKFWTHIAVGLGHQISLHKEPPSGKAGIMRRRLWWSLVIRDSLLSASHGRPRGINLDDCDVRPPSLEDFPEDPLEAHLFIHYVEVTQILGDLTECYSRKHMSRHHKARVHNSMVEWTKTLPDELRLFQKTSSSSDLHLSRYNFVVRQLHVHYLVVLAIMHKTITPNAGPSAVSILAASYIAGIYEDFLARDEIQYLPAIFSFYGLAAGVSLISFHRYPCLRKMAEQDLEVILNAELELGKRWPAARGFRSALKKMIASLPKANPNTTQLELEIPKADVNAYFSAFGPALCRVRNAVFGQSNTTQDKAADDINRVIHLDYIATGIDLNGPGTDNSLQQVEGALTPGQLGVGVGINGMFGLQSYDDHGYWLFNNWESDFPLE